MNAIEEKDQEVAALRQKLVSTEKQRDDLRGRVSVLEGDLRAAAESIEQLQKAKKNLEDGLAGMRENMSKFAEKLKNSGLGKRYVPSDDFTRAQKEFYNHMLARANALWESGERAEAADKYRRLDTSLLNDDEHKTVRERLSDFDGTTVVTVKGKNEPDQGDCSRGTTP